MAFLKLLLYGGLIFITATALADENTEKSSITFDYIVTAHYDIKLIPYFEDTEKDDIYIKSIKYVEKPPGKDRFFFYGELNTTTDIFHPITKINLNSSSSIRLIHGELMKQVGATKMRYLVKYFEYDIVNEICILNFEKLLPGTYMLNIKFLNIIDKAENIIIYPLHTIFTGNMSVDTAYFQFGVRRLFPCWEISIIKSTFNISIKHHRNYKTFSNMPIRKQEICKHEIYKTETSMMWTYFDTIPAMSSYIVTITLLPMSFLYFDTDKVIMWHRPELHHMAFALRVVNKLILQFESKWKKLDLKVQLIAILGLPYDIENWGLMLNRETNIIYDETLHSIAHKIEIARLISREMAYQWFGNFNNPRSSYLWLIDGLATLFGMHAVNEIEDFKNSEISNLLLVQIQCESLRLDTHSFMKPLSEVNPFENNIFSYLSRYIKAPLILHMLRYIITEKVFLKGTHQYLNQHVVYSITPDDFWTVMQAAVDESYPKQIQYNFFLTNLINSWIRCTDYPILKITRNYSINSMNITIENYDIFKHIYDFWIPVTYTTQNNLNFESLELPFHDSRLIFIPWYQKSQQIFTEDNGWVMFNLQQSGYYRVNYDSENWQRIAEYLNSKEYTKVHVLNRAKIIDDAFHFLITRQLDSSIFWNLTSYLAQEESYIAWYPMIKALEHMSSIFPLLDERVKNIKDKINNMLNGLLLNIKYEEDFEEKVFIKCLRQEAIKWACILDDPNCHLKAYEKLSHHIENPGRHKLLPWWKEWIYCKGLMIADNLVWQRVMHWKLVQNRDNRFLEFLACTQRNIDKYLKFITMQNNGTYTEIQANNYIYSFLFIIAKHAKRYNVLYNILINFEELKPRNVSRLAILTIIINHVYSTEQLDMIKKSMNNIIEMEAYIQSQHTCKRNTSLSDKIDIEASFHRYNNLRTYWMLYAKLKLDTRLFEITRQMQYLRNLSDL